MSEQTPTAKRVAQGILARARWHPLEFVFWAVAFGMIWMLPNKHLIMTEIAWLALFALSLDLILGYAGVVSLGHAAFFGIGAYTAGIFSKYVWGDVFSGLIVAGLLAALVGWASSFIVARFRHLTLIMITLGLGLLLAEAANRAHWLTGGSDGLQGMAIAPIFGVFDFDLYGKTAYAYSLAVLFVMFLGARRLVNSPFGLALRGIRENFTRMPAIGAESRAHIRTAYTIAACMAGVAGAVIAQTTQTVALESIGLGGRLKLPWTSTATSWRAAAWLVTASINVRARAISPASPGRKLTRRTARSGTTLLGPPPSIRAGLTASRGTRASCSRRYQLATRSRFSDATANTLDRSRSPSARTVVSASPRA